MNSWVVHLGKEEEKPAAVISMMVSFDFARRNHVERQRIECHTSQTGYGTVFQPTYTRIGRKKGARPRLVWALRITSAAR